MPGNFNSYMSSGGTTGAPAPSGSDTSNKDVLLIVASVSMALATIALILVVRILERCLPDAERQETQRQLEKKSQKMKELIDSGSSILTYSAWVEKMKVKVSAGMSLHDTAIPVSTRASGGLSRTTSRVDNSDLPVSIGSPSQNGGTQSIPRASEGSTPWCDDCAVCLTEFSGDETIRELQCTHIFHEECLHGWFVKSKRPVCPLCRYNLQDGRIEEEHHSEIPNRSSGSTNPPPAMEVV